MRKFTLPLIAAAVAFAAPASAAVTIVAASSGQGTLVHGIGVAQTALDVVGALGAGGPQIVHFTGDTTQTASTSDLLHLQQGQGQADVTGAIINNNNAYALLSGNIFLSGGSAIDYIEFGLTSGATGTVDFIITGSDGTTNFFNQVIGNGDTFFAFNTTGLSTITNVFYRADSTPGSFSLLKQVRIDIANGRGGAVPEPATWAMMLVGFGAAGYSLRRRRRATALQAA